MNPTAFLIAFGVGLAFQGGMVWAGRRNEFVRVGLLPVGGVTLSLAAGLIYGRLCGLSVIPALLGGAAAGALGALVAFAVSVRFKDVSAPVLGIVVAASLATGALGAAVGRVFA